MRFENLRTGTKILGAFAVVSLAIVLISLVSLWRMEAAARTTRDLVDNKLARQQATSELLGVAHLNGVRTVSIARSDSLELGDYFQAQLAKGEQEAAAIEARLARLPASPGEAELAARAARAKAAWLAVRKQVFQAKEFGQIQEVEQLAGNQLAKAFGAYTDALDALLASQASQARAMADSSARAFDTGRVLLLAFGAIGLLVGAGAAWLLTRGIVTPLQEAVRLAERVAEGDLSAKIAHRRGDEIGRMFDALNHMTEGMSAAVVRVLDSAHMIDQASAEMAEGNRDLSYRTEEQASSLHETVRSMVELTEAVEKNHVNANEANELALAASSVAQQGAQAVAQMVERMDTIRQSAARINDITSMIDGIAFQTNILALNAAVEAARAGSEGRGFAVVAAEVRNLAQHSASAAKEIKVLIGESTGAIESGAGIAGAAGGTMRQILERVQHVADLLQKINAASSEQAAGIAQVRRVIDDMDNATQQNAAMVEEAAASAETMRAQAEQLTEVVATFKVRRDVEYAVHHEHAPQRDEAAAGTGGMRALPALGYA